VNTDFQWLTAVTKKTHSPFDYTQISGEMHDQRNKLNLLELIICRSGWQLELTEHFRFRAISAVI